MKKRPPVKMMPDMYEVEGTDGYGIAFRAMFDDRELADYVARRVNGRGGEVKVTRQVYNSPKATYLPAPE